MSYNNIIAGSGVTITSANCRQTISASGGGAGSVQSFSPILSFGGGTTGITYITQTGTYQQLTSNLVYISGLIELSSKGSSTGSAKVSLPLTASATLASSLLTVYCINLNAGFVSTFIGCQTLTNTTTATLAKDNGIASSAMADTDFTNTSAIYYNGCYFI